MTGLPVFSGRDVPAEYYAWSRNVVCTGALAADGACCVHRTASGGRGLSDLFPWRAHAAGARAGEDKVPRRSCPRVRKRIFVQGVLANVLNPKVVLAASFPRTAALMRRGAMRCENRIGGGVFVGPGVRLAGRDA